MGSPLTDFECRVLEALVGGYRAREGMKERLRALNEWEIARRSGYQDISYAEYAHDPIRRQVSEALVALEAGGLVTTWGRGAIYDSFVPTPEGAGALQSEEPEDRGEEASTQPGGANGLVQRDPVVDRLDEIIRLLRSLEQKLDAGRA